MPEIFRIPVDSSASSYKVRMDLEGEEFVFKLYFNERMNRWLLSIYDANEEPILMGIALNVDGSLIGRYSDPRLPPGELIFYDTSAQFREGGRNDLGDRCLLLYETAE